jgi:hypothetical protein
MGIARVKIAPVEHWCQMAQESAERTGYLPPDVPIEILTETMHQWERCDGRVWQITQKTVDLLRHDLPPSTKPKFMCEHMLEMD